MQKKPEHVAIIMDGNGRWAQQRGFPRLQGHYQGAQTAKTIISSASRLGIRSLTLYGFSKDNWQRPIEEVKGLLTLLGQTLQQSYDEFLQQKIRIQVIGDQNRLPSELKEIIQKLCTASTHHSGMQLTLAISYSSRTDIVNSIHQLVGQVQKGQTKLEEIDESCVRKSLSTAEVTDPDLIIRTGGEKRLSDFLLFESAYTELYFTDILWPDFTEEDFQQALLDFSTRHRRFGKI